MPFTLCCMDGEVEMPSEYMDYLGFVKDAADDEDEPDIQAPDITTEVAEQVKAFCEQHKAEPVQIIKARFELMNGADFLQCEPLLELCAASIASYCKSLPKHIHDATFGPSQDFTPEQERQLLQENNWPEDDL